MLDKIKEELILEEYDYCFDLNYIVDEDWEKFNGSDTRDEVYSRNRKTILESDLEELKRVYGSDLIDSITKGINEKNKLHG